MSVCFYFFTFFRIISMLFYILPVFRCTVLRVVKLLPMHRISVSVVSVQNWVLQKVLSHILLHCRKLLAATCEWAPILHSFSGWHETVTLPVPLFGFHRS